MTTARRSWRSSALAAALGLGSFAGVPLSAHRLDEYLQAARIAIDPRRVQIELDLTPGVAIAQRVVAEIDRDRNGSVASEEGRAYAARVLGDIEIDVDGRRLSPEVLEFQFPAVPAMLGGEGVIRIRMAAAMPALAAGAHRLRYRNAHHPDIGVYLANALAPASERVQVTSQKRDVDQRELAIEYLLGGDEDRPRPRWGAAAVAATIALAALLLWRWSRR